MLTEEGFTFAHCYLCVGRTDLRKGIDGLVSIVRLHYNRDLLLEKDSLFLFCGGRRDRIKGTPVDQATGTYCSTSGFPQAAVLPGPMMKTKQGN